MIRRPDMLELELARRAGVRPLSRCVLSRDVVGLELQRGHCARGFGALEVGGEDIEIGFQTATDQWARDVVLEAWALEHPGTEPTLGEAQTIQAVGRFEGSYGLATRPAAWVGSNNWGAVQCGHGAPCGDSCFETRDTHADGSEYHWCYKRYPSAVDGARDVVRLLTTKRPTVWDAMRAGDADGVAGQMRATGYHETAVPTYAERIAHNAHELADALGEEWVVRRAVDAPLGPDEPAFIPALVEPAPDLEEPAAGGAGLALVVLGGVGWWWLRRAA